MKKISSTLLCTALLFAASSAPAQVDRSKPPVPGPAPKINIGTPASFVSDNGIQVFVVENHTVPKVTVSLVLKRDPVQEKDKAGYVGMSGQLMRRGTTTLSKEELDEQIDFLGGSVNTSSSAASASALTRNFEKIFALFSDVILHPSFPASELAKVRKQTLSSLEADKDDPGVITGNVTAVVDYGADHPYGELETEETVKNITREDVQRYYDTYWKPNIAYMAFVGDINEATARALVSRYLGSWAKGEVPQATYPLPSKPEKTRVLIVDRPAAVQTNIEITDPVELQPGNPDNFPLQVMNQVLGGGSSGWLFQDLREKYGYTYGAYSSIQNNPVVGRFSASAAVRTEVTDSALMRFMVQLNRIRDEAVDQVKMDSVKNKISGDFALSLESPSRIAQFAINIARYNLPKDYYQNYLKSVAAVSAEDVQRVARKYVTPGRTNIVLVGNAKAFADKVGAFGPVSYLDIYGRPAEAGAAKAAPAGVTARGVLEKYLAAIGGEERIKAVRDLSFRFQANMAGHDAEVLQQYKIPGRFHMSISLPAMNATVMELTIRGDSVRMRQMGQEVPLTESASAGFRKNASPFRELEYLEKGYTLKLTGIEQLQGKEAYAVDVIGPDGESAATCYFDTATGYELRTVTATDDGHGGKSSKVSDYSDYRPVQGLQFPHSIVSQNGKQKISMTVDSITVNSGLQDNLFL